MKKLTFILTAFCLALATYASDYSWLMIHQINGADTYIKADGARFSVADGNLTVSHSDGTNTFTMSNLSYMAFTSDSSTIESVFSDKAGETDVYSQQGLYIGHFRSAEEAHKAISNPGVYVFKNINGTAKIMIAK